MVGGAEDRLVAEQIEREMRQWEEEEEKEGGGDADKRRREKARRKRRRERVEEIRVELLTKASSKFILLEKLLAKLREGGHR